MGHPTRSDLERLASLHAFPAVSLYACRKSDASKGFIQQKQLQSLMREAERQLEGRLSEPEIRKLFQPLRDLLQGEEFSETADFQGMAIFLTRTTFQYYLLPYRCPSLVDVGEAFYLQPLIHTIYAAPSYYLLHLTPRQIRLYSCNGGVPCEHDVPSSIPRSIVLSEASREVEESLFFQPSAIVNQAESWLKSFRSRWADDVFEKKLHSCICRLIAQWLDPLLEHERSPLVLAAPPVLDSAFRQTCDCPGLISPTIPTSPDSECPDARLFDRAKRLVKSWFDRKIHETMLRVNDQSDGSRASHRLEIIVPAAQHGLVETIVSPLGQRVWGVYDAQNDEVSVHLNPLPGDVDLVDLSVKQTLLQGRDVFVVPPETMPSGEPVAAVLRW